jgi:hypothetical protein
MLCMKALTVETPSAQPTAPTSDGSHRGDYRSVTCSVLNSWPHF